MSESKLSMRLRGLKALVCKADPLLHTAFTTARDKAESRAACDRFRVMRRSDLMQYDGEQLRAEARADGEWEQADGGKWRMWVNRVRTCFVENQMLPMVMPEPRVEAGAVLAYKDSETGATACGCVERMRGRVVRMRLLELARGRTRAAGRGQVGRRMAMHAEGGGVAELDLAEQKWVRVDTAESGDVARAVAWMQRGRQRADFEVSLVSAADHIDMRRNYVKRLQTEEVSERLPDADASRLRTELEGVGRGVGEFTQLRERYLQLAANAKTENRVLFGFSDGALSEDGRVGAYSWLVAVKKGDTKLEVLAGGGGGAR